MAESQDTKKKINVNIKTPKDKQTVEIEEDASIKDVSVIYIDYFKNFVNSTLHINLNIFFIIFFFL